MRIEKEEEEGKVGGKNGEEKREEIQTRKSIVFNFATWTHVKGLLKPPYRSTGIAAVEDVSHLQNLPSSQ